MGFADKLAKAGGDGVCKTLILATQSAEPRRDFAEPRGRGRSGKRHFNTHFSPRARVATKLARILSKPLMAKITITTQATSGKNTIM